MRTTIVGINYKPEPTGIAPYTSGLAVGLKSEGMSVSVITAYPHYPAWKVNAEYLGRRMDERVDGIEVRRIRPYIPERFSAIKRALMEISFGISSAASSWHSPDVVVLVSPALFSTAVAQLRARMSWRRPAIVVWVQDIYSLGVKETGTTGKLGAQIISMIESRVLRSADRVVVIHDRFRDVIVSQLGVRYGNVRVVRNWTHLEAVDVDRMEFRTKFGWGDEIVVLHAGNMGAKQALENVVEAARLADQSQSNVRFVLLGDGNQRNYLEALAEGVARVTFMSALSDVDFQGAMAAADILLVNEKPGVSDMAVPSKLTSYFLSQRPIIAATDAGSITAGEVETAGAGVRVNAGDPAALLSASLKLGNNRELGDELGRLGGVFQAEILSESQAITSFSQVIADAAAIRGSVPLR